MEYDMEDLIEVDGDGRGPSVCFTGKLDTMGRREASRRAERAGIRVASCVSRGTTWLVTNTPRSGSAKNRKAAALGVEVIDEAGFLRLLREFGG